MAQLADLAARGQGDTPQARAVAQQLQDALKVRLNKLKFKLSRVYDAVIITDRQGAPSGVH